MHYDRAKYTNSLPEVYETSKYSPVANRLDSEQMSVKELLHLKIVVGATGEDCWTWKGTKNAGGYGVLSVYGRRMLGHRLAYEEYVGQIPEGLIIDHICHTRDCANPYHLRAVTAADNNANRSSLPNTNTTGAIGVRQDKKTGRWIATIGYKGKLHYVGTYDTIEGASRAREVKQRELYGLVRADLERSEELENLYKVKKLGSGH